MAESDPGGPLRQHSWWTDGVLGRGVVEEACGGALKRDTGRSSTRPARVSRGACGHLAAPSGSATGENPGASRSPRDEEKFTFEMNPCAPASGPPHPPPPHPSPRPPPPPHPPAGATALAHGAYKGDDAYGVTEKSPRWSYGREASSLLHPLRHS